MPTNAMHGPDQGSEYGPFPFEFELVAEDRTRMLRLLGAPEEHELVIDPDKLDQ